jgi:hypothetical protein
MLSLRLAARFAPLDRTDVRLGDTHDAVIDPLCAVVVHVLLLAIEFAMFVPPTTSSPLLAESPR